MEHRVVHNLKRWYSDMGMIGRHFLVYSKRFPKIKRHYTICSCMRPELMNALLKLAHDVLNSNQIDFNTELLSTKDQDKICLTLKNYKMERGVSTQIHRVVPVLDPPEEDICIDMVDFHDDPDVCGNDKGTLGQTICYGSPDKFARRNTTEPTPPPKIQIPTEVAMMATHNMNSIINAEKAFDTNGDIIGSCNMRPLEEMFYIKGPMGRGLQLKH